MRSILTLAGRCLAVVVVLIGLSSYGCMDIASVNPVAELASLTVTPGTLQPAFTAGTTQYNVDLTRDVTSVRITAQPAVAGDTLTINGQATTSSTIPLGPEGSTTSVSIVVSESSNNSRTYIVLLKRASLAGNNSLQSLTVSPGTLAPAFNANTLRYTVNVANSDGSITVIPRLQDRNATMTVEGRNAISGQAQTFTLPGPGSNTLIDIVVTAQNGTQKTYIVSVNRGISGNNFLGSLIISPSTLFPAFSASTLGYTVNVASNVENVMVTPTLQDSTATMTVNGQATTSGQGRSITLNGPSSRTFINIVVTAENADRNTYVIDVTRAALGDNHLFGLSVRVDTVVQSLSPDFIPNTTAYTVNVASSVAIVSVTATMEATNATMTINDQETSSGQTRDTDFALQESSATITIVVTAPNGGVPNTYRITVNRLAPLAPADPPDLRPDSDSGISNTDNITNVLTPSFIVSKPAAGETANLYVGIVPNPLGIVTTTEAPDPTDATKIILTLTNPLPLGVYDITATYTMTNAGGESPQSPSLTVTIDTGGPASP